MESSPDRKVTKVAAETAAVATVRTFLPQNRDVARIALIAVLVVLAAIAAKSILRALTGVLLLVILSIFFAYLISPLVEFVRRPFRLLGRKLELPRGVAIGIVYVFLFGALGLTIYLFLPRISDQIAQFVQQVPAYLTSARGFADRLNGIYQAYSLPVAVRESINAYVIGLIGTVGTIATAGGQLVLLEAFVYLPWLILIPILAFFLLKDADSFRRSALQMLPSGRWRWRGDEFFQDINRTLAAYIRAQLIACVLIGLICTLGFLLIGMPYALLLGVLAGFLEFIPLVGPLTLAVIAVLIASFYSLKLAAGVLLFLAVLRIVHDYVTYPRIIGQGIHLHPLAVILAILCGAELAGITGIFLAIPVVAIATVTYRHWLEHRGSSGLVADLLKPEAGAAVLVASSSEVLETPSEPDPDEARSHPTVHTTAEEMERVRPDLTSGALKLPEDE
jgi:predicted PurR-regulated permease PerM